jgi:hypothetical protein
MTAEERFLRHVFGDEYRRYRRGVARPPTIDRSASDVARRFSAGRALANREHRAVVGLLLVVLLLAWKATYNEPFWRSTGPRAVRPGS